MDNMASPDWEFQDVSVGSSKLTSLTCSPYILEESVCSNSPILDEQAAKKARICESFDNPILYGNGEFPYADISGSFSNEFSSLNKHTCCGECGLMLFKIHEVFVHVDPGLFMSGGILSVECLKDEVACLCYLQLPAEKRSQELFPLIQDMRCGERVLDNFEEVTNFEGHLCGKGWIDVSASGCIQKRLMKIYVDCCIDLSESPNLNILKKLYNLEFREDEVFVSDCELDDASITALLNALEIQKTFGILNLSHNSLGKGTVEKLQKVFASCQKWDCFVLDLHQNILGPDSLYQVSYPSATAPKKFSNRSFLHLPRGNTLSVPYSWVIASYRDICSIAHFPKIAKKVLTYSINILYCSPQIFKRGIYVSYIFKT